MQWKLKANWGEGWAPISLDIKELETISVYIHPQQILRWYDKEIAQFKTPIATKYTRLANSEWLSSNCFYANTMDTCVLPRIRGFWLGKLVSTFSNKINGWK